MNLHLKLKTLHIIKAITHRGHVLPNEQILTQQMKILASQQEAGFHLNRRSFAFLASLVEILLCLLTCKTKIKISFLLNANS